MTPRRGGSGGRCAPSGHSSSTRKRSTSRYGARAPWRQMGSSSRSTRITSLASGPTWSARSFPAPTASACWRYVPPLDRHTTPAARCNPVALSLLDFEPVASPEAKNLEAISKAIDQHNSNCPFPAAEVRMNPFEIERLGWDQIRGLPLVPDSELGTGRFRIVCSRDLEPVVLEVVEAVGQEVETVV